VKFVGSFIREEASVACINCMCQWWAPGKLLHVESGLHIVLKTSYAILEMADPSDHVV